MVNPWGFLSSFPANDVPWRRRIEHSCATNSWLLTRKIRGPSPISRWGCHGNWHWNGPTRWWLNPKKEATQSMRINVYKWYKCHLKNMKDVSRCEMMADLSTQYIITDERWLKYLPRVISGGFCFRPLQVWKVMYPSFERCHALGFSGNSCCSVNSRHLRKDFVNAFKGFLHMFGSKSPRTYRVRPPKLVCEPIKYSDISGPPKLSEL